MNGKFIASDMWVNSIELEIPSYPNAQMKIFPEDVQVMLTRVSRKSMLFLRQF